MKSIILEEAGNTEKLVYKETPKPEINDNEVLIQAKAISINPVDIKTRSGKALYEKLKENNPLILGWDVSGVVTEVGKNVNNFSEGDEVFGMVNFPGHGKAYAEYVAAPAEHLAKKPENITHEEAAASTLVGLTAWQVLVTNAAVKSGDRVLIHAASGGVGHVAVQIAKHLGAYVIGTSSAKNKDFVMSLGTDEHIDYHEQSFEDAVSDINIVFDAVGGDQAERSLKITKKGGTIISIAGGVKDPVKEKAKELGINAYPMLVASNGNDMQSIADLLAKGELKMHVSKVFAWEEMPQAHAQIESGRTVGKVVIKL